MLTTEEEKLKKEVEEILEIIFSKRKEIREAEKKLVAMRENCGHRLIKINKEDNQYRECLICGVII